MSIEGMLESLSEELAKRHAGFKGMSKRQKEIVINTIVDKFVTANLETIITYAVSYVDSLAPKELKGEDDWRW